MNKTPNPLEEIPEELRLRPEVMGLASLVPSAEQVGSMRAVMMVQHFFQRLNLIKHDEKIVQTGFEHQLLSYNFGRVTESDIEVVAVIDKYRDPLGSDMYISSKRVIFWDMDRGRYDLIDIPKYESLSKTFGFEHRWTDKLLELSAGDVLPKGTQLSRTPSDISDDLLGEAYGYGKELNTILGPLNFVAEDAGLMSKSKAEEFKFNTYQEVSFTPSKNQVFLNLYGDETHYQPFPDKGQKIRDDKLIFAVRDITMDAYPANNKDDISLLAPILLNFKSLMEYDPNFDKGFYANEQDGVVEDITVLKPKPFKSLYTQIDHYGDLEIAFNREVVEAYKKLDDSRLSPRLVNEVSNSMAYDNPAVKKYKLRDETFNTYSVKITVKFTQLPTNGYKFAGIYGDKFVIGKTEDDEFMPYGEDGTKVDLIQEYTPTTSRLNYGRLTDMYFAAAGRECKKIVKSIIGPDGPEKASKKRIEDAYAVISEFASHFNNLFSLAYSLDVPYEDKFFNVRKTYYYEQIVHYLPGDKDRKGVVGLRIKNSRFRPKRQYIYVKTRDGEIKKSDKKLLIAPMYIMLLDKITNDGAAVATPYVNHFELGITPSAKQKVHKPFNYSGARTHGETETRTVAISMGEEALAELRSRALHKPSIEHEHYGLLYQDKPLNSETHVPRNKVDFGAGKVQQLFEMLHNVSGREFNYAQEVELIDKEEIKELEEKE